jgi:hypothetical protein
MRKIRVIGREIGCKKMRRMEEIGLEKKEVMR